ncbi:hypothetical protein [Kineothrix sedimenti]|uniref:Nucleoside 2-deoxyribosyltransferase-like protein n=1 Tax=Kineothrix sedimenti TaxID=3123317 RepID=A0ABZ3ERP1_9FIRM
MMSKLKIFLSAPISAFNDEKKYEDYRNLLFRLIIFLRENYDVYSEIEQISGLSCYDEPGKSAMQDFQRILESNIFMLHHPARMQTSALIELGYAFAEGKKIILIGEPKNLPYLALGLAASSSMVRIVSSSELNNQILEEIMSAINDLESL